MRHALELCFKAAGIVSGLKFDTKKHDLLYLYDACFRRVVERYDLFRNTSLVSKYEAFLRSFCKLDHGENDYRYYMNGKSSVLLGGCNLDFLSVFVGESIAILDFCVLVDVVFLMNDVDCVKLEVLSNAGVCCFGVCQDIGCWRNYDLELFALLCGCDFIEFLEFGKSCVIDAGLIQHIESK